MSMDVVEIAGLNRFMLERLPKPPEPENSKPCLAEDWFVSDAEPQCPAWMTERDLRRIWRVARMQRFGLAPGAGCPWLLLHQMAELLPALFAKAAEPFARGTDHD